MSHSTFVLQPLYILCRSRCCQNNRPFLEDEVFQTFQIHDNNNAPNADAHTHMCEAPRPLGSWDPPPGVIMISRIKNTTKCRLHRGMPNFKRFAEYFQICPI